MCCHPSELSNLFALLCVGLTLWTCVSGGPRGVGALSAPVDFSVISFVNVMPGAKLSWKQLFKGQLPVQEYWEKASGRTCVIDPKGQVGFAGEREGSGGSNWEKTFARGSADSWNGRGVGAWPGQSATAPCVWIWVCEWECVYGSVRLCVRIYLRACLGAWRLAKDEARDKNLISFLYSEVWGFNSLSIE